MYRTFVEVIKHSFNQYSDRPAFSWREKGGALKSVTFREVETIVQRLSYGLLSLGVRQGEHIGLIADVSRFWSYAVFGIQYAGAVDVPRGSDSTEDELGYILSHSKTEIIFVQNSKVLDKIEKGVKKHKGRIKKIIILDSKIPPKRSKKVISLEKLLEMGKEIEKKTGKHLKELEKRHKKMRSDDVVTIIYTSGTTGKPKGVMLTQGTFASQINLVPEPFKLTPADRGLTILPPWHVFGRICEFFLFEAGAVLHHSDLRHLAQDLKEIRPTIMPAVPRLWESLYNKIVTNIQKSGKGKIFNFFKMVAIYNYRAMNVLMGRETLYSERNIMLEFAIKLFYFMIIGILAPFQAFGYLLVFKKILAATGGELRGSISGGGALPRHIDEFFGAIGLNIYEGYGLTETSPVISVRLPGKIVVGTVGPPVPSTEYKVISSEGVDVTSVPGAKGTLYVRGLQVMKGYYKEPKKSHEVLDSQGWFNTGDLVRISIDKLITIVGRSKDTIVLRGGENVEPVVIEKKLQESSYINNVVVVGHGQKHLGALISPDLDELTRYVQEKKIPGASPREWVRQWEVQDLYVKEAHRLVNTSAGFYSYESIFHVAVVDKPFEVGDELSTTFKVKRFVVQEKYSELIQKMYDEHG